MISFVDYDKENEILSIKAGETNQSQAGQTYAIFLFIKDDDNGVDSFTISLTLKSSVVTED